MCNRNSMIEDNLVDTQTYKSPHIVNEIKFAFQSHSLYRSMSITICICALIVLLPNHKQDEFPPIFSIYQQSLTFLFIYHVFSY